MLAMSFLTRALLPHGHLATDPCGPWTYWRVDERNWKGEGDRPVSKHTAVLTVWTPPPDVLQELHERKREAGRA